MTYETYWSILDSPAKSIRSYDIFFWIILLSILCWILIKKFKKSNGDIEKLILLWFFGIVGAASIFSFGYLKIYDKDESYQQTKRLLESSKVGRVEGVITNFRRGNIASRRGVQYESFTVDSVDFFYSNELFGKFNGFGSSTNWIFKNGLPVKITYGKEYHDILKIEIEKSHYSP